jgi:hypothetical protein
MTFPGCVQVRCSQRMALVRGVLVFLLVEHRSPPQVAGCSPISGGFSPRGSRQEEEVQPCCMRWRCGEGRRGNDKGVLRGTHVHSGEWAASSVSVRQAGRMFSSRSNVLVWPSRRADDARHPRPRRSELRSHGHPVHPSGRWPRQSPSTPRPCHARARSSSSSSPALRVDAGPARMAPRRVSLFAGKEGPCTNEEAPRHSC